MESGGSFSSLRQDTRTAELSAYMPHQPLWLDTKKERVIMINDLIYCTCELQSMSLLFGIPPTSIYFVLLAMIGYLVISPALTAVLPQMTPMTPWWQPELTAHLVELLGTCSLPMIPAATICLVVGRGAIHFCGVVGLGS